MSAHGMTRVIRPRGFWISTLVPVAFLALFYFFPILIMVVYSFWAIDDFGMLFPAWNFDQYKMFFADGVYAGLLFKSVRMAMQNTVVCALIAYPVAYFIARIVPKKWRYLMLFLIILPSWTSFLIRTYAWVLVLGEKGVINYVLLNMGVISEPLTLAFTSTAVMVSLVHIYLPYMVLPMFTSIEKIDFRFVEAAESLGASKAQCFFRIILPLSLPGAVSGSIMVLIPTIGEYVIPMILGGNSGMMYSNAVTAQFLITNWPLGAALSFILLIVIMTIFAMYSRVIKIEKLWSGQ